MFIYNVTVKVDGAIADNWLQWMKEEHIPEVMHNNCFTTYKIVRLLEVDDTEGPTYAIQYYAATMEDYKKYINDFAPGLRKKTTEQWGDRVIAFRTLMQIVQ